MPPPDALLCIRYGLFSLIACCACISLTSLKCPKNAFTKLTRRKTLNRATLKEKRLAHSRNGQTREFLYTCHIKIQKRRAPPASHPRSPKRQDSHHTALAESWSNALDALPCFRSQVFQRLENFLVSHTRAEIGPAIRLQLHFAKLLLLRFV